MPRYIIMEPGQPSMLREKIVGMIYIEWFDYSRRPKATVIRD